MSSSKVALKVSVPTGSDGSLVSNGWAHWVSRESLMLTSLSPLSTWRPMICPLSAVCLSCMGVSWVGASSACTCSGYIQQRMRLKDLFTNVSCLKCRIYRNLVELFRSQICELLTTGVPGTQSSRVNEQWWITDGQKPPEIGPKTTMKDFFIFTRPTWSGTNSQIC